MIIGDKDNHTTHFVDLVKRTLKGGNVDVSIASGASGASVGNHRRFCARTAWARPLLTHCRCVLGVCVPCHTIPYHAMPSRQVPVTATGDVKETTKFPSRDEMAALATHVPPSWVDAREVCLSSPGFQRLLTLFLTQSAVHPSALWQFVAKLSGATVAPSPNEVAAAATAEAAAAAALAEK